MRDLFQDDSDDVSAIDALTINDDFASKLEFQGQLAMKQKFDALGDAALVPLGIVEKVVATARTCRRALVEDKTVDEAIRTSIQNFWYPGRIAAFVIRKFGLTPSPTIKARIIPKEFEMPQFGSVEEKAVNELILMREMKRMSGELVRWAVSLFGKHGIPTTANAAQRKRTREEGTVNDGTDLDLLGGELNEKLANSTYSTRESDSTLSEPGSTSCTRAHQKFETDDTSDNECTMPQYSRPPIFTNPYNVTEKRKRKRRKPRGRGAGKGRGLNYLGEPPFEEMHESWQLKRRISRRQRKVIARALSASKTSEPITVVL